MDAYDHFNQFGDIWTYRFAGSYLIRENRHDAARQLRDRIQSADAVRTKFSGTTSHLDPERGRGWDAGVEQRFWNGKVSLGATYFHNRPFEPDWFQWSFRNAESRRGTHAGTGSGNEIAADRPISFSARATRISTRKILRQRDITQLPGARLPRRPRNEVYVSGSYLWFKKLRTTAEAKFVNAREELNFGGPNFDIEDYSFVNLAAEYEINSHLTIFGAHRQSDR